MGPADSCRVFSLGFLRGACTVLLEPPWAQVWGQWIKGAGRGPNGVGTRRRQGEGPRPLWKAERAWLTPHCPTPALARLARGGGQVFQTRETSRDTPLPKDPWPFPGQAHSKVGCERLL